MFRQLLFDLNAVLPFIAEESQGQSRHLSHRDFILLLGVGMGEHPEIRDDGLHPLEAIFDIGEDFGVVGLLLGGEVPPFFSKGEQAGGGEIQGVINFVDDAGAHAAQGRKLFRLHQLQLIFFELLKAHLQRLAALVELAAGDEFPRAHPAVEIRAGDDGDSRRDQEK